MLHGARSSATARLKQLRAEVLNQYQVVREFARQSLGSVPEARESLLNDPGRMKHVGDVLHQAKNLYGNLLKNEGFVAAMGAVGYDQDKLRGELENVEALADANAAREQSRGVARAATQARNQHLRDLEGHLKVLRKALRSVSAYPNWRSWD